MTIQKKSLLSKMNTGKKANDNSIATQENPSVSAPVAARHLARSAGISGRRMGRRRR